MKQAHAPSGIPIAVPTLRDQHRHLSSKALRSLMPSLADREAVERLGGGDDLSHLDAEVQRRIQAGWTFAPAQLHDGTADALLKKGGG